jgi:D-alanine-D-alanine ligase
MKIAVLTGGCSSERNVSLSSGKAITDSLRSSGHDVRVIDPYYGADQPSEAEIFSATELTHDKSRHVCNQNSFNTRKLIECVNSDFFNDIDIAFIALHGKFGEDGMIQSLLELRKIKYTGSGVSASAVAMNKNITKLIMRSCNIKTPEWITIRKTDGLNIQDIHRKIQNGLGYPVVIKPNDEGSTVGLSILSQHADITDLSAAVEDSFRYSDCIIIERYIDGRELTVSVLGNKALPVIEIKPKSGFYDYKHKYTKGMTDYICPAELDAGISHQLQHSAIQLHDVIGCRAYSRIDFRMNRYNEVFCLEINTLPGMTELSLVPKAARAAGITFDELLNTIIELSLQ